MLAVLFVCLLLFVVAVLFAVRCCVPVSAFSSQPACLAEGGLPAGQKRLARPGCQADAEPVCVSVSVCLCVCVCVGLCLCVCAYVCIIYIYIYMISQGMALVVRPGWRAEAASEPV